MLPQCLEEGMTGICPVPGGLQVVLDGDQGFTVHGDSSKLIPLADDINDGLVPVGLRSPILRPQSSAFRKPVVRRVSRIA